MNDTTDILLNLNMVREHGKDFTIFIYRLIWGEVHVEMKDSMYYYTHLDAASNRILANLTGLHINTVRKYTNEYPDYYEYAGSIAPLPITVFHRLEAETKSLTAAEKNGVIRTFCYFVCMCWSFQNFSRSVENIAAELDNKVCDVSRRINWLVQHGFIYIKHHQMNFAGQDKHPRVYQLYIDEIPANYVNTKWWRFNVAARETQTVDSILDNFKNSF